MPLRRLLALESGGTSCSVALLDGHGGLSFQSADSGQSHSSQLLPMAEALLSDAGMTIADVDGVVVGIGPGSFTGLRIAVGVAQGLALGKACPVLGVSGFELWAYIWWQSRPERFRGEHGRFAELSISFDARLGERFVAQLRVQQTSDQLVLESRQSPCVCMADDPRCAVPIALIDPTCETVQAERLPVAAWMIRFASDPACARHHVWTDAQSLRPLYVRDKVAQTISERSMGRDLMWSDMTERDIASVMVIEGQAYPFPWTSGNFLDSLRAGYRMRMLKENGVMIGYVIWMAVVDEAHLLNLTLSPARQGRGLGSWMLQQFFEQVRAEGLQQILLEVRPSNQRALGLYTKFGFQEIGRRRGYYPNSVRHGESREDAIVMQRSVASTRAPDPRQAIAS